MFKLKYIYSIVPILLVVIIAISLGLFGYRIFKTKSIYTSLNNTPEPEVDFTNPSANKTQGDLVAEARGDLALQSGIKDLDISTVSVEAVNWSDSSLGCPTPKTAYAQVITPGYKIILKVDDEIYTYHASSTNIVLCQSTK
ncbi:hypothetical protein COW99_01195 [Candidatus Roizmanbacteria bacterium CG22_combo_CG10-13_8_21_14_all_38_20]|uniref:Uncharacterized protein n=1 Tax=Candidatus Roizmanbacteria bacterium CG22_combo_CG10-13_8_21_14_all_38_20 TaxID=1974862 RepID=A0A2H0BYI3_9BACT|nr:hypothetical protein [Candidatus Microgenomates bacterium]PIP61998.1 MAG: hypothetical protein COW99_01195 [Candidatus Roizmanbacteria bacterium CG22_combo_CG10-13_8_21_14_all_38_20]PJC31343.1 MAG: hypothetical protein CO050_03700 [Candidatus Roizmanbacteria bacterium CG_4_9_14_0_2_um_filter_38_17]